MLNLIKKIYIYENQENEDKFIGYVTHEKL